MRGFFLIQIVVTLGIIGASTAEVAPVQGIICSVRDAALERVYQFKTWIAKKYIGLVESVNKASSEKVAKKLTKEELKEKARKVRDFLKHLQDTMLIEDTASEQDASVDEVDSSDRHGSEARENQGKEQRVL
ncbi:hypothetical protein PAEPH01_0589 [Pancytospora epiphaga]|nr:hypothetical protein PAEPH01_0589 [Pancytospora epiphaga]